MLGAERPNSYDDCVAWARLFFQEQYHNQIAQLLHNFPADQKTSSGQLFWSGPKRCPKALVFDAANPVHLDFVLSGANLRAEVYGVPGVTRDGASLVPTLKRVAVPEFAPREGVRIAANDAEAQAMSNQTEVNFKS